MGAIKQGQFNTGREYAPEGQIIKWKVLNAFVDSDIGEECAVMFYDITRGIRALVWILDGHVVSEEELKAVIMDRYDRCVYRSILESDWDKEEVPDY